MHKIVSAIGNKAHYGAQLVIVNYYSLSYASALVDSESMALNNAVDGAASKFHVEVADGPESSRQHR